MISDLINHIAGLPRPAIITIDGRSGAGKTTLAAHLRAALKDRVGTVSIEVESLCQGWDDLHSAVARARALVPTLGEEQVYGQWDWESEQWRPVHHNPAPLTFLVGCGAGQIDADFAIWVEAPPQLRRSRVARRDPYDWSEHWDTWERQETELLRHRDARECADLVISGTGSPVPDS